MNLIGEITVDTSHIGPFIEMMNQNIYDSLNLAAWRLAEDAQNRVAVDTGSLQDSIDAELVSRTENSVEWSVNAGNMEGGYRGSFLQEEGTPIDYAYDQEFLSAHPYMIPSAEAAINDIVTDIVGAIARASVQVGI